MGLAMPGGICSLDLAYLLVKIEKRENWMIREFAKYTAANCDRLYSFLHFWIILEGSKVKMYDVSWSPQCRIVCSIRQCIIKDVTTVNLPMMNGGIPSLSECRWIGTWTPTTSKRFTTASVGFSSHQRRNSIELAHFRQQQKLALSAALNLILYPFADNLTSTSNSIVPRSVYLMHGFRKHELFQRGAFLL
jgi:hypothetical protein